MRVPLPLRDIARTLGLHDWIFERSDFPLEAYCRTVDDARAIVRRHQPPGENFDAAWEQLVPTVAQALDTEGALADRAVDAGYEIADDAVWRNICLAGGWVVLERYEDAVNNGKWTPA